MLFGRMTVVWEQSLSPFLHSVLLVHTVTDFVEEPCGLA